MRKMLVAATCLFGISIVALRADPPATKDQAALAAAQQPEPKKELLKGKVVFVREALERRGIKSTEEFDKQVALETPAGELLPIVPDWRGRAFYQDERLRNRDVEVIATRRPGVPYLQVSAIYTFDEQGQRQFTDYWCDICAIPMYEIKPCECCQQEIRLRFQPQELPDYIRDR